MLLLVFKHKCNEIFLEYAPHNQSRFRLSERISRSEMYPALRAGDVSHGESTVRMVAYPAAAQSLVLTSSYMLVHIAQIRTFVATDESAQAFLHSRTRRHTRLLQLGCEYSTQWPPRQLYKVRSTFASRYDETHL